MTKEFEIPTWMCYWETGGSCNYQLSGEKETGYSCSRERCRLVQKEIKE